MSQARHDLAKQTAAARLLLATYEDILGEDAVAKADAVEGETSLHEAIRSAVVRLAEIKAMQDGADGLITQLKARSDRLEAQAEHIRTAIGVAMEVGEVRKIECDVATISLKSVPPKVEVISEADIPSSYWKPQDPKLDKKALLDALKDKIAVPGAVLGNGSATVSVRWS